MEENIEIFYSDDDKAKQAFLEKRLAAVQSLLARGQAYSPSPIFTKALNRVLNDDHKRNPGLTLVTLKNLFLIVTSISPAELREYIEENSPEVFLHVCSKIFAWEFRRLDKIYAKFVEVSSSSQKQATLQTLNLNIATMARVFTIMLMMLAQISRQLFEWDDQKLKEFKKHCLGFGLAPFLVRVFDFEDSILLRASFSFLSDFMDEQLAEELVRRGIFQRIVRFLPMKEFQVVFTFLNRLFSFQMVRDGLKDHPVVLQSVCKALEQNQIANALQLLNLVSLEPSAVDVLLEADIDLSLMNLLTIYLKKDPETVEKNKLIWNVMINFAAHPGFASKVLNPKILSPVFEFLFATRSFSAFKFLENIFTFATDEAAKTKFGIHTVRLLELFEQSEEHEVPYTASLINILAEIYAIKERKGITIMMRILKKKDVHPNIFIASFRFLNKALFAPNFDPETINSTVIDYCVKRFFAVKTELEEEVKFQLLFFVINAMIAKNYRLDFNSFLEFVQSFEEQNMRSLGFILTGFDAFLLRAENSKQMSEIRTKKLETCAESFQMMEEYNPYEIEDY